MKKKDLVREFRLNSDKYDLWGKAMSAWFEVCAELHFRNAEIPDKWQYSPGISSDLRNKESYWYDILIKAKTKHLIKFGEWLCNRELKDRKKGRSY